jgi:hypothetical protein
VSLGLGTFWARLKLRCEQRLADQADRVMAGKVSGYDDYREAVGFSKGVQWVLNEARDILGDDEKPRPQNQEEDDD